MAGTIATTTVLGTTKLANGLVRKRVSFLLDTAYPVAGYDINTAAVLTALGISRYQLNDLQTGFVDPVVTGVSQTGILAEIKGLKLLLSFPSGGAGTSPAAATTAPVGLCGTGAATASAVDATRPTVGLTPGAGKACAASMDASSVTVFADVYGYQA